MRPGLLSSSRLGVLACFDPARGAVGGIEAEYPAGHGASAPARGFVTKRVQRLTQRMQRVVALAGPQHGLREPTVARATWFPRRALAQELQSLALFAAPQQPARTALL